MNRKRLQAVLRVRSLQERGARGELARRSQAHQQASIAEAHTWQRLEEYTASATGHTDLVALQLVRHAGSLAAQRQHDDTVAALDQTLVARDAWTAAARRVEALDRLGERLREVADAEDERLQILEIDDLVLARRGRGLPGGAA